MQTRNTLPTLATAIIFLFAFGLQAQQEWLPLGNMEGAESVELKSNDAGYNFVLVPNSGSNFSPSMGKFYRRHKDEVEWKEMDVPNTVPFGGRLIMGLDGVIYFTSWNNNIQASYDQGDTWEEVDITLPTINFEVLSDLGNGVLILAETTKIHRSTDGGESWEHVFTATQSAGYRKLLVNPINGELYIYSGVASQGAMIYSSSNNGLTWEVRSIQPSINDMAINQVDGTLYVATNEGVKKSVDGGLNWDLLAALPDVMGAEKVECLGSGRIIVQNRPSAYFGDLFYSDDQGTSWVSVVDQGAKSLKQFTSTPSGEMFGFRQGLICSKDGGLTWSSDMKGIKHGQIYDYAEMSNGIQFAASGIGVFRSTDEGQTWEMISQNVTRGLPSVEVNENDELYVFYNKQLLISQDGGDSFTSLDAPEYGFQNNPYEIQPKFIVHQTGALFVLGSDEIHRSMDNGITWTSDPCPLNSWGIYTDENGTVIVGTQKSFIVSEDLGETWGTRQPPNISTFPSVGNFFVFRNGEITFTNHDGQSNKLYHTTDLGMTWTMEDCPTHAGSQINYIINDAGFLFVPGPSNKIKYSVDKGMNWDYLPELPVSNSKRIYYTKNNQIIANSPNGNSYIFDAKFSALAGAVKVEEDADCAALPDDVPVSGWKVKATDGTYSYYGVTDNQGSFGMLAGIGDYNVQPIPPNNLWEVCPKDLTVTDQHLYSAFPLGDLSVNALYDCPFMTVDVSAGRMVRCFDNQFFVRYSNTGTTTAENAYVVLEIDPYFEINGTSIPIANQNGREFTFELGNVEPNKSGFFKVDFTISCDAKLNQWHCVEASIFPNEICGDFPDWTGSIIEVEGQCQNDGTVFTISNTGDGDMVKQMPYLIHNVDGVVEVGLFKLNAGESINKPVANKEGLFIRVFDEIGYPYQSTPTYLVSDCDKEALHWDWANSNLHLGNSEPFNSSFCQQNRGSFDPNDKTAYPAGYGEDHLLEANVPIDYLIRFQNTGTDTAFKVVVIDTLTKWLDPASIELGASSHPFTFEMSGSREDGGVILKFIFENIMLPDSNINEAASHGFVKFHIDQVADNPIGTRIENKAAIYFDFNEPVITNTAWHVIGEDFFPTVNSTTSKWLPDVSLDMSPNPYSTAAMIKLNGLEQGDFQLKIFDLTGKILLEDSFSETQYLLRQDGLPSGVLVIGIYQNNLPVVFDKLVKMER